ncbi:MAG: 50S ribosomal protein L25 [bacterium]|nr:50S ribosomal protein L25 [bacterium]
MTILQANKREAADGTARALRRAGVLPAVVYGAHQAALAISMDARAFGKAYEAAGESTIVSLEGLGGPALATLIHEVDLDPVTYLPRHVDFYAVTKGQMVEVFVELIFVGESPAVKLGANLVKVLHEIEIEADPTNLPHEIEVDVSSLEEVGDQIHAKNLALPSGVTLVTDSEEVIALIQEVEEEKVEEAPVDLSAIEVEARGKEVGEDATLAE